MLLIDLSHTSHTQAQTGIQRVCRGLFREISQAHATQPVTFDPYQNSWRPLEAWELANLNAAAPSRKRGSKWPLTARFRGRLSRLLKRKQVQVPMADGLLVPEVFSPHVARNLTSVFNRVQGPRVALFHDAIALKYPELSPPGTVSRFPAYLQELLAFDGIAAVSTDSANSLREYWEWLGVPAHPPLATLPLPLISAPPPGTQVQAQERPVVLCVGSIEGRKNHLALLDACEQLWAKGVSFELHLIGLTHRVTGRSALRMIKRLQVAGRALRYDGAVDEQALEAAYARCTFTVYPSLMEGFGLPVLESLSRGKPCICSTGGALGESAVGGGCLTVDEVSADGLRAALETLLKNPARLEQLRSEAGERVYRSWGDYVTELLAWMGALRRHQTA